MEEQPKKNNKFINIIKSNLKILIISSSAVLIGFFIFSWFNIKAENKRTTLSENYIEAKILLSQNKSEEAYEILEKIINEKDGTYSLLSLYLLIDQDLVKNNEKVLTFFNTALSINDLKKEDLNLLRFKKAIFVSNTVKEKDLLDLLNPIINSNSVWRVQVIKFLADYYYFNKEYTKADQYYSDLLAIENIDIDKNEIKRKIKSYKE